MAKTEETLTSFEKNEVANCIAYVRSCVRVDRYALEVELSKMEANGKTTVNSEEFAEKFEKLNELLDTENHYGELLDKFNKLC